MEKTRRIHENSLKNLRPQKRGEPSHNPRGRPRKPDCLVSCIKSELGKLSVNGVQTNEELIAVALVQMAAKGNLKAIELTLEYTATKPKAESAVELKGAFKVLWDGNRGLNATQQG